MSKRSKIHHFIPQTLQRRFTIELGSKRIWFSERNSLGQFQKPAIKNIQSTFKKRNLYTITENGKKSDIIERKNYAELDNFLGDFLGEIHNNFYRGIFPLVTGDSLTSVRLMIMMMLKRTPHFIGDHADEETGRAIVQDILKNEKDDLGREEIVQLEGFLEDRTILAEMSREARVKASACTTPNIVRTLQDYVVRWAVPQGKSSFILSGMGVCRVGNGVSSGLASSTAELWMPISPKLCVVMVRDPYNKIKVPVECNSLWVRKFNAAMAKGSNHIASHSENLLHAIIEREVL